MKKTRFFVVLFVLLAAFSLLTVSLAFAGDGGNEAAEFGALEGVPAGQGPCEGGAPGVVGIWHDDGSFENGYSGNPTLVSNFEIYSLFTPPAADYVYTKHCVALVSLGGATLDFEIVFRADNGGTPGAELAAVPASETTLPGGLPCGWFEYDLTGVAGLPTGADGNVWIGTRYNPQNFPSRFTCSDESVATPLHPGYVNFNTGSGWQTIGSVFLNYRSMSHRVEMTQQVVVTPAIAIEKAPDVQQVTNNGIANFTITVTNTGNVTLTDVAVADALVADCDSAVGTMAPGDVSSYTCSDLGSTNSYTNTAVVTSLYNGQTGPAATDTAYVEVVEPTGVALSEFGAEKGIGTPQLVVGILLVAVLGFGLAMRRKFTN